MIPFISDDLAEAKYLDNKVFIKLKTLYALYPELVFFPGNTYTIEGIDVIFDPYYFLSSHSNNYSNNDWFPDVVCNYVFCLKVTSYDATAKQLTQQINKKIFELKRNKVISKIHGSLILSQQLKNIFKRIQNFFNSKNIYEKYGIKHRRGVLLYGPPGTGKCLAKGTRVLMYDGTLKEVEKIKIGDELMGPDSLPRIVLEVHSGWDDLFEVKQKKGINFFVNSNHILSVYISPHDNKKGYFTNISINEYFKKSKSFKHHVKGYKSNLLEWDNKQLELPAYYVGLWLGDGTKHSNSITTMDKEIIEYLQNLSKRWKLKLHKNSKINNKSSTYSLSFRKRHINPIFDKLKKYNLINNKHIPKDYLINSSQNRLDLLAGLLDSDGHYSRGCFEISQKNEKLANDIVFLARSLGFYVSIKKAKKQCVNNGKWGNYFKILISGNLDKIPTKLKRKQAKPREQKKNHLVYGISIEKSHYGQYYGFELNGDGLFILEDFTVTHNSSFIHYVVSNYPEANLFETFYDFNDSRDDSAYRKDQPNIIYIDEVEAEAGTSVERKRLLSNLENVPDNTLVLATTNLPEKLGPEFYNRPGRFEEAVYIGYPNKQEIAEFLKSRDCDDLLKYTDDLNFAHLNELIYRVKINNEDPERASREIKKIGDKPLSGENRNTKGVGFLSEPKQEESEDIDDDDCGDEDENLEEFSLPK